MDRYRRVTNGREPSELSALAILESMPNERPGDRLMALGTRVHQLDEQIRSLRSIRGELRLLWEAERDRLLDPARR
jgi:hypothetical protein